MKFFLINLDRAPERLERMSNAFSEMGLDFTRVKAVDGRELSKDEVRRWRGSSAHPYRPGEVACFLSHRECWRRIVDENLSFAAIFEDDLHFGEGLATLLDGAFVLPRDADVVKIETKLYPVRLDKKSTARVGGRELFRLRSKHAGGGAYIITKSAAKRLLQLSRTFCDPVDQFLFNPALKSASTLVTYQLFPAICIQDFVLEDKKLSQNLGSDLHDERQEEKPRGLAKLWRELKRPVRQLARLSCRVGESLLTDRAWTSVPFR